MTRAEALVAELERAMGRAAEDAAEGLLEGASSPVDRVLEDALGAGGAEAAGTQLMEWAKSLACAGFKAGVEYHRGQIRVPPEALADRAVLYATEMVEDERAEYSGRAVRELLRATFVVAWNANQEAMNRGARGPVVRRSGTGKGKRK